VQYRNLRWVVNLQGFNDLSGHTDVRCSIPTDDARLGDMLGNTDVSGNLPGTNDLSRHAELRGDVDLRHDADMYRHIHVRECDMSDLADVRADLPGDADLRDDDVQWNNDL